MTSKTLWNTGWSFTKDPVVISSGTDTAGECNWETVDLPHTWNGTDGQDGGNDYYRGTCFYRKKLLKNEFEAGKEVYLEFTGTNSTADLYVNGKHAAHHDLNLTHKFMQYTIDILA